MRISILSFVLFFITHAGYSQTGITVYYEAQTLITKDALKGIPEMLKADMLKQVNAIKTQSILYLQGNENLYHSKGKDFMKNEDNLQNKKNNKIGSTIISSSIEVNANELKLIKNVKKDNYLTKENGKLVSTPLPKVTWKFTNKTKIIAGYTCFEATTTYKNYKLTVFFTKELREKGSPYKLPFLDGVILEYNYSHFYMKAVKIDLETPLITKFL